MELPIVLGKENNRSFNRRAGRLGVSARFCLTLSVKGMSNSGFAGQDIADNLHNDWSARTVTTIHYVLSYLRGKHFRHCFHVLLREARSFLVSHQHPEPV